MDSISSSSTSPSSSLPAAAASSSRWPRLAPEQHAAHQAATSAPMDVDSETSAAPCPAAPAAPPRRVLPARRLMRPPFTVENIFRSFTMRRVALIRALTTDEEELFQKCEPAMPVMYLFGNKDGSWEVKPPETYVPHSEPEPAVGINKARDSMKRHKWLQEVARHSDAWLISISFYFGSFLTAEQRKDLFTMINSLPTVQETFLASETYRRIHHREEQKSSGPVQENQEEEDVLSGEDKNFCASCGDRYHANAFWIGCNVCERWYHGKCVKIRASEAENIDHYECPECCSEKVGHDYDEDPKLSELFRRY